MNFKIQLIVEGKETALDIASLEKELNGPETLGLSLSEAKNILQNLQQEIVGNQIEKALEKHAKCPDCKRSLSLKDRRTVKYRTLYGTLNVQNPRYYLCRKCHKSNSKIFLTPLADLLKDHTSPELSYLEAKWASLMSYGLTVDLLKDSFPIDEHLCIETVRKNTLRISEKLNNLLGEEKHVYAPPFAKKVANVNKESTIVGLDGGYLRAWDNKKTNFELIAVKSIPKNHKPCVIGLVSSEDEKPKRRLLEMLKAQGIRENDKICFMSDGGESLKNLQKYISPNAQHILEWFHITMKITVLGQYLKGLGHVNPEQAAVAVKTLESIKWKLWHGKPLDALTKILKLSDLSAAHAKAYSKYVGLIKHISEFFNYISNNVHIIANYAKRWKEGKLISTAFVESLVNYFVSKRFCKKQQMQWSKKGAHLLIQVRAKVINNELRNIFKEWYKDFDMSQSEQEKLNLINLPKKAA